MEVVGLIFRRSLFFIRDMVIGEIVSADDVKVIRPGHGLPSESFEAVTERSLSHLVKHGTPVS